MQSIIVHLSGVINEMRFNKLDARAREHPSDAVKDELFSEAFESCRQDCMIGVRKRE